MLSVVSLPILNFFIPFSSSFLPTPTTKIDKTKSHQKEYSFPALTLPSHRIYARVFETTSLFN